MATATQFPSTSKTTTNANNGLLSATVVSGLKNLGTTLTAAISKTLIANALKLTLHPDAIIAPVPEIYATNAASAKQSEYAVVTLYAVATKHGWDSGMLRQQLESLVLHASAIDELTRVYDDNRKDLVLRQLQLGHNFPHITDVQWRIVCDAKSSTPNFSSGAPHFHINLGHYRQSSGERITILEFMCNAEELHSLINRLKDIERHCNQVANT
ncbi:COMM domain-containing protein 3 [Drosophila grimshawi]|uniref:COMM domain-containing protein 3 n=1 Tax=Drosophila grimshawi TaxID=7222 RepID=B4JXK8_DROGR|nr:COMM domain-containing protein 3 [Drosophila grimshawi]EDV95107.1 GH17756 [Drosophila grimshawi]